MNGGEQIGVLEPEQKIKRARELCAQINLDTEETDLVLNAYKTGKTAPFLPFSAGLRNRVTAQTIFEKIDRMLSTLHPHDSGIIWLALSLLEMTETERWYRQKNIPEHIFTDTMKCFSRFAREYRESFGKAGFNTAFWAYRQLSGTLFRLGTLEFELWPDLFFGKETEMNSYLHVHIPSDADLSAKSRHESYQQAKQFTAQFFPNFVFTHFYTETWLLAPQLQSILKPESRILEFQSEYKIISVNNEARSYITRIFKDSTLTVAQWPENTSLQRAVKAHVQGGGTIPNAAGLLDWNKTFDDFMGSSCPTKE